MAIQIEYKVVYKYNDYSEEEEFLNKMGQEGWEMIDESGWKYRFKREKR